MNIALYQPDNARRRSPRRQRGFTLIETVLAIGLTAIGLVALLGLVPHGLNTMKAASDQAIQARIAQLLSGEVNLTDWTEIENFDYTGPTDIRYFDREGVEITKTTKEFEVQLAYVARVRIDPEYDGFILPGNDGPGGALDKRTPVLRRVIVDIANVPIPDFSDWEKENYVDKVTSYTGSVVKMLRDYDQPST